MKKIAIIGAGYTGMSAAKKLLESGYDVTVYEKDEQAGGMTKTINIEEEKIEKYYRHIFKCDTYCLELIRQMGLEKQLKWLKAKMGYYTNHKKYLFGQALTLLTFKPLSWINKIKFGIGIIKIKTIKDYKK